MSHYKASDFEHWYIEFPAILSKQRRPRRPQSSFVSNVGVHRRSSARSVSEMRHLPSSSGHKPATSRRRCHCYPSRLLVAASVYVFLGRRYIYTAAAAAGWFHAQWTRWVTTITNERGSANSSSGFTLVAELEQLPADWHVTLDSPGDDYWLFLS